MSDSKAKHSSPSVASSGHVSAAGGAGAGAATSSIDADVARLAARALAGEDITKGGIFKTKHQAAIKKLDAEIAKLQDEITKRMALKAAHMLVVKEAERRVKERREKESGTSIPRDSSGRPIGKEAAIKAVEQAAKHLYEVRKAYAHDRSPFGKYGPEATKAIGRALEELRSAALYKDGIFLTSLSDAEFEEASEYPKDAKKTVRSIKGKEAKEGKVKQHWLSRIEQLMELKLKYKREEGEADGHPSVLFLWKEHKETVATLGLKTRHDSIKLPMDYTSYKGLNIDFMLDLMVADIDSKFLDGFRIYSYDFDMTDLTDKDILRIVYDSIKAAPVEAFQF